MSAIPTFTNRRSFAAVVRKARAEGRVKEYARHTYGFTRMCSLTDGTFLLYRHPWMLNDVETRQKGDDDGVEYADPRDAREERRNAD